jgi:hypothetical protein
VDTDDPGVVPNPGSNRVTALPTSPYDGQEVYFVADNTNGIIWHLRYNAASSSTYKWEIVGGSPLDAEIDTDQQRGVAAAWGDLTTVGPQVVAPLAGEYEIMVGCGIYCSTAGVSAYMAPQIGATAPALTDGVWWQPPSTTGPPLAAQSRRRKKTVTALATTICAKYYVGAGTANFANRWLSAMPVRVG